jgi:hypothetical protein
MTRMKRIYSLFLFAPLLFLGCGRASTSNPEKEFGEMEARLLAASHVSFNFHVVSEGVLEGDLRGSASVSSSGGLTIDATGSFIGREIQMQLFTETDSLRMITNEMSDRVSRPQDTFTAVVIGLTRMGFLHNLAQLTTVSPPEHADGGIADWVVLDNFAKAPIGESDGIGFDILVEGEKTSSAVLGLQDGVPVQRRQVVEFPGGQMIVTESYSNFSVSTES